jgi:hypothetical protein
LLAPDRKSTQDFHLSHIEPNKPAINPQFFQAVNPKKPWKAIRVKPGDAPPVAAKKGRPRGRGPVGQALQRPQPDNGDQPR